MRPLGRRPCRPAAKLLGGGRKVELFSPGSPTKRPKCLPPAPGVRGYGEGTLYAVGDGGYSWASSVATGTYAYNLAFGYGGVNPNVNNSRSYGFPLRCLQE